MAKGFGRPIVNSAIEREAKLLRQSVLQYFEYLEDPRVDRTQRHSLMAIVTISIFAVLSGADGFVAIETYGRAKQSWLERFLDLPNGIPSHDTFGRVLGMIEPQQLHVRIGLELNTATMKPYQADITVSRLVKFGRCRCVNSHHYIAKVNGRA